MIGIVANWLFLGSTIVVLSIIGILVGSSDVGISESLSELFDPTDTVISTIIWEIRLPRLCLALLAGGCMGLAGALIQLSTRSPLGDANLFGIGGGSALVLAFSMAGIVTLNGITLLLGSIAGALLVSWLLTGLIVSRNLTPTRLILMGIALGSLMVAVSISVVSYGRVFPVQAIGLVAGSFTASTWEMVRLSLIALLFSLVLSLTLSGRIRPMLIGDTLTRTLGINPFKTRVLAMGIVAILTGTSVYGGGMVAFVGLVSPHIARRLFGNAIYQLFIGSTVIGSLLVLLADQVARLLAAPTELPIGLTTTLIGAPVMIYLALKIK